LGSPYVSGRTRNWLKFKNPAAPAVKREAEEDWGKPEMAVKSSEHAGAVIQCSASA
jgi:ATP-dependent DNA ligase